MLFILTTLLVGPAFAVSAARQRRTLALAATNGAETRQLRRTVLAQALVARRHLGGGRAWSSGVGRGAVGLLVVGPHPPVHELRVSAASTSPGDRLRDPAALRRAERGGRGPAAVAAPRPARHHRRDARPERLTPAQQDRRPWSAWSWPSAGGFVVLSAERSPAATRCRSPSVRSPWCSGTLLLVPAPARSCAGVWPPACRWPRASRPVTRPATASRSTPDGRGDPGGGGGPDGVQHRARQRHQAADGELPATGVPRRGRRLHR